MVDLSDRVMSTYVHETYPDHWTNPENRLRWRLWRIWRYARYRERWMVYKWEWEGQLFGGFGNPRITQTPRPPSAK